MSGVWWQWRWESWLYWDRQGVCEQERFGVRFCVCVCVCVFWYILLWTDRVWSGIVCVYFVRVYGVGLGLNVVKSLVYIVCTRLESQKCTEWYSVGGVSLNCWLLTSVVVNCPEMLILRRRSRDEIYLEIVARRMLEFHYIFFSDTQFLKSIRKLFYNIELAYSCSFCREITNIAVHNNKLPTLQCITTNYQHCSA
jgi:hypothetical protein